MVRSAAWWLVQIQIQWALRRLDFVRGGRFVAGFIGQQYTLPAAVE